MKKYDSLELICPDCSTYRVLRFSGFPIPEKVECPSCQVQYKVIELCCTANARPANTNVPELNNLNDLIEYGTKNT